MTIPIAIVRLYAYEGPNIYGPSPGVGMVARCDRDRTARVRAALKDGAQAIGMVIAHLSVEAQPSADGWQLVVLFSCERPSLGAELCRYVVAGIHAEATGDQAWDADAPLVALQAHHRQTSLPVVALQVLAEARRRGVPSFITADGQLQLGYGARGWKIALAEFSPPEARTPPWERLGSVPVVLVTGEHGQAAAVEQISAELQAMVSPVLSLARADFAAARTALADPKAAAIVLGLRTEDLLERGLPCERCELAVITDRRGPRPAAAADDDEWVRALGIPMLLSAQPARVNLSDAGLLPLVPYAPNGVLAWNEPQA